MISTAERYTAALRRLTAQRPPPGPSPAQLAEAQALLRQQGWKPPPPPRRRKAERALGSYTVPATGKLVFARAHHAYLVPGFRHDWWTVSCYGLRPYAQRGLSTCLFWGVYDTHQEARDAADAHMIFTHVSGGVECGHAKCPGCRAIRRVLAAA